MSSWLREWSYYLLPGICLLCGSKTLRRLDLCHLCESDLPWIRKPCILCAKPVSGSWQCCPNCALTPPLWQRMLCPFSYEAPLDYLIHQFKYRHQLAACQVTGSLLAMFARLFYQTSGLTVKKPDVIVPVPLHKSRLRERGYNQSAELAQIVADALQVPVEARIIRRLRNTPPQQQLEKSQRLKNLNGAFTLDSDVSHLHIALLDDVITTGSTLTELSRLLQQGGAYRVDVFVLARTDINTSTMIRY